MEEAQRLLTVSVWKLYRCRVRRGGLRLHRSLQLSLLVRAARHRYLSARAAAGSPPAPGLDAVAGAARGGRGGTRGAAGPARGTPGAAAMEEAQRLLTVSVWKLYRCRVRRGGLRLHRSLQLSNRW
ncbi:immediate early response gene 5 protein-like [Passer montanus]|uniref:immediate early response gene 5 protein-like n=1 Tax=Passer montanus TaxID=9160 RepID=UPI0019602727|nr:immediate early response gene 5 protein-like [Passer montanus]